MCRGTFVLTQEASATWWECRAAFYTPTLASLSQWNHAPYCALLLILDPLKCMMSRLKSAWENTDRAYCMPCCCWSTNFLLNFDYVISVAVQVWQVAQLLCNSIAKGCLEFTPVGLAQLMLRVPICTPFRRTEGDSVFDSRGGCHWTGLLDWLCDCITRWNPNMVEWVLSGFIRQKGPLTRWSKLQSLNHQKTLFEPI